MLEESLELDNVMSVLSGQSEYKGNYRINDRDGIHYYQFRFIKNEDSGIIVLGFLNVDDVVESEIRHQKLLKEALDTAERANAEKSNFLSRMSHDMRTPLNGIIGLMEIDKKHENDIGFLKSNREKHSFQPVICSLLSMMYWICPRSRRADLYSTMNLLI